jgi:hypothetical protein
MVSQSTQATQCLRSDSTPPPQRETKDADAAPIIQNMKRTTTARDTNAACHWTDQSGEAVSALLRIQPGWAQCIVLLFWCTTHIGCLCRSGRNDSVAALGCFSHICNLQCSSGYSGRGGGCIRSGGCWGRHRFGVVRVMRLDLESTTATAARFSRRDLLILSAWVRAGIAVKVVPGRDFAPPSPVLLVRGAPTSRNVIIASKPLGILPPS